jgi:hypothetical protein
MNPQADLDMFVMTAANSHIRDQTSKSKSLKNRLNLCTFALCPDFISIPGVTQIFRCTMAKFRRGWLSV